MTRGRKEGLRLTDALLMTANENVASLRENDALLTYAFAAKFTS